MSGKGDWPRPVDKEKFNANFDRIFGVHKDEEQTQQDTNVSTDNDAHGNAADSAEPESKADLPG
jgi:hypothetical protein